MIFIMMESQRRKDRGRKKPSTWRDLNPRLLDYEVGTIPLRYNRSPIMMDTPVSIQTLKLSSKME